MVQFTRPRGLFVSNGEIYIADAHNHRVRKVLQNGQIVTICGTGIPGYNGDGQLATNAQLNNPLSVFVSSSDQVYISEIGQRIRKIDRNGVISTIAGTGVPGYNGDDQLAVNAQLNHPYGLFVTGDEQVLFADLFNNRVRKIDQNGMISTIAGNGEGDFNGDDGGATSISLFMPTSVFQYKNEIYIADSCNNRIRKIDRNGIVTSIEITVKGISKGAPFSVVVHNDEVYFTDGMCKVYKIRTKDIHSYGTIQTIAGIECKLNGPKGIFIDSDSQIYISDTDNHCIRKIDQNGMITTVIGTGQEGYSGDVPFDFKQYPHIGPRKKPTLIKPFPHAYHDLVVICDVE